jgi:hypothetical protein
MPYPLPTEITGRDEYLLTQALAYAISIIELTPIEDRAESDGA